MHYGTVIDEGIKLINELEYKQQNSQIANISLEDLNIPFEDWEKRVGKYLLPIFQKLDSRIQESGIDLKKGKPSKGSPKIQTKERQYLYQFYWEYGGRKNLDKPIQFRVGFKDNYEQIKRC
ncbi:MAG: hypothetical protein JW944_01160 [Deltaproteobacteria bacterium]|nr:hypothetical protein [Deltaproteobacteria bacterium]